MCLKYNSVVRQCVTINLYPIGESGGNRTTKEAKMSSRCQSKATAVRATQTPSHTYESQLPVWMTVWMTRKVCTLLGSPKSALHLKLSTACLFSVHVYTRGPGLLSAFIREALICLGSGRWEDRLVKVLRTIDWVSGPNLAVYISLFLLPGNQTLRTSGRQGGKLYKPEEGKDSGGMLWTQHGCTHTQTHDNRGYLHKSKPAQIHTWLWKGLPKHRPELRSHWLLGEGGSLSLEGWPAGRLPMPTPMHRGSTSWTQWVTYRKERMREMCWG